MDGITAVVVDHHAGDALEECLRSLLADGAHDVVVVDNAASVGATRTVDAGGTSVRVVATGANLGYGSGVNRGVAATAAELIVVSNPDVTVHPGALAVLAGVLTADPTVAVAGPRIVEPGGRRYASARRFPCWTDALGHALLGVVSPRNRFSRRYRMEDLPEVAASGDAAVVRVDWVSGACFMVRRSAFEELGGFDEAYFMYAEDMDLCWRARRAGWEVVYAPSAVVTHVQALSTGRRPYRMLLAHHRSALRFAVRTQTGWRRAVVPGAAAVLAVRLVTACARQAASSRSVRTWRMDRGLG
jgi:N-acetylglucosaminyl-diphospho-decaprenol L-rhamnosyltransferase